VKRLPRVTAVEIRCRKEHHLVATLHPVPATGEITHIELCRLPARYRRGVARYLLDDDKVSDAWVTSPGAVIRMTLAEFDACEWLEHVTWGCRCGLGTLSAPQILLAVYQWSLQRSRVSGSSPRPVMVTLGLLPSVVQ
jgi:hypothetical protein